MIEPAISRDTEGRIVEIIFEVLGTPAPKGSSRAMLIAGHALNVPSGSDVNRRKLKTWDANVRECATAANGYAVAPAFVQQPLWVHIRFFLRRPAGHFGKKGLRESAPLWPTSKPDVDKLARATLDSMKGTIYDDDSRIASLTVEKHYAGERPEGASIAVMSLQPATYRPSTEDRPGAGRRDAAGPLPRETRESESPLLAAPYR